MKRNILNWVLCWAVLVEVAGSAITVTGFGPKGEGGTKNGQSFLVGPAGSVYELDAFVLVPGTDLNGTLPGEAGQLSRHALPAGLAYGFSATLTNGNADARLTYSFTNIGASTLTDVRFLVLLDAEIGEATNTFFNEYGEARFQAGASLGGLDPTQWQIDEPGFVTGTLVRNLLTGALSNSNAIPQTVSNDVALALGFSRPLLWPGDVLRVEVMVSEAQHALGPLTLLQLDHVDAATTIALSGQANAGALSGNIYGDLNTNGVPDVGEGLEHVKLVLADPAGVQLAQAQTDASGHYDFGSPPLGTYRICVDSTTLPARMTNAVEYPNPGGPFSAERVLSGTNVVLNWGYAYPATAPQEFVDVLSGGQLQMGLRWRLNYATGSLLGTLSLTNPPVGTFTYSPPYQLRLLTNAPNAANFFFAHPAGTADGLPYLDLAAAMQGSLAGGVLAPGQRAELTDVIEIYSRDRSTPALNLFGLWATRQ